MSGELRRSRLRGLEFAKRPINLIQVMLAKGNMSATVTATHVGQMLEQIRTESLDELYDLNSEKLSQLLRIEMA